MQSIPQNQRTIDSVRRTAFDYLFDWEKLFERCGVWMPWQEAEVFHSRDFTEANWRAVKTLWDRKIIYHTAKVVPYCPHCLTPLSRQEAILNSKVTPAQQAFLRLPLLEDSSTSLLVWCNEIWKLSAKVAVAVHPEAEYVIVVCQDQAGIKEKFILSRHAYHKYFANPSFPYFDSGKVIQSFKGKKLKDVRYRPLFIFVTTDQAEHYVILDDKMDAEQGSGIVPITAIHDDHDYQLSLENDLPLVSPLQKDGTFLPEARPWNNKFFKDVETTLLEELTARGLVVWQEDQMQATPLCPYCQTPLIPHLEDVLSLDLTPYKEHLQHLNEQINWIPEDKAAVFQSYLDQFSDWIISRRNSLGIPAPIWVDDENQMIVVGSFEELASLTQKTPEELPWLLPAIDELVLIHPQTGKQLHRLPDTLDAAFTFALLLNIPDQPDQWTSHSSETASIAFSIADLICEPFDEMLPWLYAAHILNGLLPAQPAARRIITVQSFDNQFVINDTSNDPLLTDWSNILDQYGADFLRWALYKHDFDQYSPNLSSDYLIELSRPFFMDIWKAYVFFITFSQEHHWNPERPLDQFSLSNENSTLLERWILSSLQATLRGLHESLQGFKFPQAISLIEQWGKQLTQVFLPLMHQFFWDAPISQEANRSLQNLHYLLSTLSRIIAPFAPFLAEEIYQNVVRRFDHNAPISVHLSSFPTQEPDLEDEDLNRELAFILHLAEIGKKALEKGENTSKKKYKEAVYRLKNAEDLITLEKHLSLLKAMLKIKRVSARLQQSDFNLEDNEYHLIMTSEEGVQVILMGD